MQVIFKLSLLALCLFTGSNVFAQVSMSGADVPPRPENRGGRLVSSLREKARRGEAPLSRLHQEIDLRSARVHLLPPLDKQLPSQFKAGDEWSTPLRVGVTRSFARPLSASSDAEKWRVSEGNLAAMRVASNGAVKLRLHFSDVDLPAGARLFVYSSANPDEYYGPYEGRGPLSDGAFWTPPVSGDEVVVEYFEPGSIVPSKADTPFRIETVSHIFADMNAMATPELLECQREVTPEWREMARSVAILEFTNPKGEFVCTGTLLNSNREKFPNSHYLLTANHCVPDAKTAETVKIYWLYDSNAGPSTEGTITRPWLAASGVNGDYSLLNFSSAPPSGVRYSGWTTEIPPAGTAVTSITHPGGSWKRIAFGETTTGDCPADAPPGFCDEFVSVRWNSGRVEPGSSGGGLWAGPPTDPKLFGIVSRGVSNCNVNEPDFFGRFDLIFPAIQAYLIGEGCRFEIDKREHFIGASGGIDRARLRQITSEDCDFSVRASVPWIKIHSTQTVNFDYNQIERVVNWAAEPNPSTVPRYGLVIIGGQSVSIYQAGSAGSCAPRTIAPGETVNGSLDAEDCRSVYDPDAYADRFTLTAAAGQSVFLKLTSTVFDTFLTLIGPDGSVVLISDDLQTKTDSQIPNDDLPQWALSLAKPGDYTIEVSSYGQRVSGNYQLKVETRSCSFIINPTEFRVNSEGGKVSLNLEPAPNNYCFGTMKSEVDWIVPAYDYINSSSLWLQIAPQQGDIPRTGIVNIGGVPVTVRQEVPCTYEVMLAATSAPSQGAYLNATIKNLTGGLCYWQPQSDVDWLSAILPEGISDGGNFQVVVSPNFSFAPRSATIHIAGKPFTISQAGAALGCPALPLERGRPTEGILNDRSCRTGTLQGPEYLQLNAPLNRSQLYQFSGRAGENVTIALSSHEFVGAVALYDPDGARIITGGQQFGFFQTWGSQVLPKDGIYTVEASSFYRGDTGTFTIELTTQSNASCVPGLSGLKMQVGVAGGSFPLDIRYDGGSGCQWSALSRVPWATIDGPAQGTDGGKVTIKVGANNGFARSGIINVAGLPLYLVQDGAGIVTVSAAGFDQAVAPEGLAVVFGDYLARRTISASTVPLPKALFSTMVFIKDSQGTEREASLLYISPHQINFQIPAGTSTGPAQVKVVYYGLFPQFHGPFSLGTVMISETAPRLFTTNATGRGAPAAQLLRVQDSGSQIYELAFQTSQAGGFEPRPIDLGRLDEQVYLVLYATGMRRYSSLEAIKVMIGGIDCQVTFAGPAPGYVGLDQVNVLLPASLRDRGEAQLTLTVDGQVSNAVTVRFGESEH
jgi:lysyl endopeptidase